MASSRRWLLQGGSGPGYDGEEARLLLIHRLDWATQETWFEDGRGQRLGIVTNGDRALVVLMNAQTGLDEHLVDPRGQGHSGGYALANGQIDTYADRDTVPFPVAGRAVSHFIDRSQWPKDVLAEADSHS